MSQNKGESHEDYLARRRGYYVKSREKYLANSRRLYRKNPEKFRERARLWCVKQPEKRIKITLIANSRIRARKNALEHNITFMEWPEKCPVCGSKLDYITPIGFRKGSGIQSENSPSLDRWDNSKGYVLENVFVICQRCNRFKNSATTDQMQKVLNYMMVRPKGPFDP